MAGLRRPWSSELMGPTDVFGPADCLMAEMPTLTPQGAAASVLLRGSYQGRERSLLLHPYPKRAQAEAPARAGFPARPKIGEEATTPEDVFAHACLARMNRVLARIQELKYALDDPEDVWARLRAAWDRAAREEDPRMAEIVRQARALPPVMTDLTKRLRRILRRTREQVPLDRVQEMDRAAMRWLSRQPGTTIAERAGSGQRILATVRKEDFNTLENRVLHSYVKLAAAVAREWKSEHALAHTNDRYRKVAEFERSCKALARDLKARGVGIAVAASPTNYVLTQDRAYRQVHEAWIDLLRREKVLDDLWAWQAESWTDFSVLAIILALDALPESELIFQSPITWLEEARMGRAFAQERPVAVFWLRDINRIIEIQARPQEPSALLIAARAHVSLRITDPSEEDLPRRVAVWTPHAMQRLDLHDAVQGAADRLEAVQGLSSQEVMRHGLILTPAHEAPEEVHKATARTSVHGLALDPSGEGLGLGLEALAAFLSREMTQ